MDVTLTVQCQAVDGQLHIQYTLENRGKFPLLAYDGSPGVPPEDEWPDLGGQIYISALDDTVALKRIKPPPLPGVDMGRVRIPPLSRVLPGGSRNVRFRLKLPLVEYSEYSPDFSGAQYQERHARHIQLWIGYFWQTESMEIQPFPANPKAFRLKGAHGDQRFIFALSATSVEARVRTDGSFRRL